MQMKKVLSLSILVTLIVVGCSNVVSSSDISTATAQAEKVIGLATQMGYQALKTLDAGTRLATATVQARQAALSTAKSWPVVLSDTFDRDLDVWSIGEDEDPSLGSVSWAIEGGQYLWHAQAVTGFVWWVIPEGEAVTDFYLSVDASQVSDPDVGEYGVIFRRDDDEQYYLFEISDLGYYALFLYSLNGWETLIDWTDHAAITAGEFNQLAVHATGPLFDLYINGIYVAGYVDERLPSGRVGLLIGLSNAGEEMSWLFDNFELQAP
jgi:hypothetical protein